MAVAQRLIGRYELVDLVAESPGTKLWRAHDPVLNRAVAIRLVGAKDPRREELRQTARAAAIVDDRRIVHVLDVIDTADGGLAVVTEWISGRNLAEVAAKPISADQAAEIAIEMARALQSAHQAGIAHGRILPSSVIICDTGPRLRGLGIDAVLFGVTPEVDSRRADIHGVGAILHAALTGKWPASPPPDLGGDDVDGLPVSPLAGGRRLTPARLVAGVPRLLDEAVACSLVDAAPPRGRETFPDLAAVIAALSVAVRAARPIVAVPERVIGPRQRARQLTGVVIALLGAVALAGIGWAIMSTGPAATTANTKPSDRSILFAPVVTKLPVPSSSAVGTSLPIVAISEFNPFGTATESNDPPTLAADGNPVSAWRTAKYKTATLDGKPGVGLLIDLGTPRPVSSVTFILVGNGTDLELRGGNFAPTNPAQFALILKVTGAGQQIELRAPSPVTVRYLLVWLTKLPVGDQGYVGGVAEVSVHG